LTGATRHCIFPTFCREGDYTLSKTSTAAVLLLIAALLSLPAFAQEATPTAIPTETPTLTPIPTLTPTDPPTLPETPTATAPATETPSPTAPATETATATASETATSEIGQTATPLPSATQTFPAQATSSLTPSPTITYTPDAPVEANGLSMITIQSNSDVQVHNAQELKNAVIFANANPGSVHVIRLVGNGIDTDTDLYTFTEKFDISNPNSHSALSIANTTVILIGGNGQYPNSLNRSQTVIERSSSSVFNLFTVGGTASLTLYNVTLRNGGGFGIDYGGAIENYGTLKLYNVTLTENESGNLGGAIRNSTSGTLEIIQALFDDNSAGSSGGAISNESTKPNGLTAQCATFQDNSAGHGGAIYNAGSSAGTVSFANSNWINGYAWHGDGGSILNSGVTILAPGNWWNLVGEPPRTLYTINSIAGDVNTSNPASGMISESTCSLPSNIIPVLPTATPTPTLTPTSIPLPTVTSPPPPTLSDYNIYVIDQNGSSYTPLQTIIYQAVNRVGQALLTKSSIGTNLDVYGVMTFRRVMVNDMSYLTSDTADPVIALVFYPQRPTIDCQTYNVGGNPANISNIPLEIRNAITANPTYSGRIHQAVIGCSTGVILSEYTVVHELGHVFDGMSTGGQLTDRVRDTGNSGMAIEDTAYFSAQPYPSAKQGTDGKRFVVMGSVNLVGVGPAWIRGNRGWGSSTPLSPSQITNFQQHYLPPPPYSNLVEARRETAADMFLNWVYRTIDPNGRPIVEIAPGNWNGFLNQSWSADDPRWGECDTTAGCIDYSYPGNARFKWIDDRMTEFFANQW